MATPSTRGRSSSGRAYLQRHRSPPPTACTGGLVAGGLFEPFSTPPFFLARWNGAVWQPLGPLNGPRCADVDRFSLHAAVRVESRDRMQLVSAARLAGFAGAEAVEGRDHARGARTAGAGGTTVCPGSAAAATSGGDRLRPAALARSGVTAVSNRDTLRLRIGPFTVPVAPTRGWSRSRSVVPLDSYDHTSNSRRAGDPEDDSTWASLSTST